MACLTCPGDLTSEGDPVPFPPSIDIDYFREKFIFETLSLPRTSGSFFSDIFQNSSFCSPCASDLLNVTHTLEEIDNLQENVARFKESFQTKLVQGIPIEPEVKMEFYEERLQLINGLNLKSNQDKLGADSGESPDFDYPISPEEPSELKHFHIPEVVLNANTDVEQNPAAITHKLMELIIPLSRLDLPLGQTAFNLNDPQFKHLNPLPQPHKPRKRTRKNYKGVQLLPNWIKCPVPDCDFKTRFKYGLKYHRMKEHLESGVHCPTCGVWKMSNYELKRHEKTHLRNVKLTKYVSPFKIKFKSRPAPQWIHCTHTDCKYKTKDLSHMTLHQYTNHPDSSNPQTRLLPDWIKCPEPDCDFRTRFKDGLKYHRSKVHMGRGVTCSICGIWKRNNYELQLHQKTHLKGNVKASNYSSPFGQKDLEWIHCNYEDCAFKSKSLPRMTIHKYKMHSGPQPQQNRSKDYPCLECSKSFFTLESLKAHRKYTHVEKDRPICEICGSSFTNSRVLQNHISVVHQGLKFPCEYCGKELATTHNLHDHIRRKHTGLKQLQCDECPKMYTKQVELEEHVRVVHREEKYQCHLCPKSFAWKSGFQDHMKSHDSQAPYKCPECGKEFLKESRMKAHYKQVHKSKVVFHCEFCSAKFKLKKSLKVHMRSSKNCAKIRNEKMGASNSEINSN